ncbi:MAG: cob(I)yrinic acid a,c-diamide adenosyltransferase [Myxococcota bacterium]
MTSETDDDYVARMRQRKKEQDEETRSKSIKRGVVVVNTGDGKGKSTSGFGVAIRAAGHGQRVAVVQFIKGTWKTGEKAALARFPEITHVVSGDGFTWETQDRSQDMASARHGFDRARAFIQDGDHDVVVLDEINIALDLGYLPVEEVCRCLETKPEHVSVVLTGRNAPQEVIDSADTVTEMKMVKHAYKAGIRARKGIEF